MRTAGGAHLTTIEVAVDNRWDRTDLCAKLLFNAVEVEAVVVCDEVDGEAQVPKAT